MLIPHFKEAGGVSNGSVRIKKAGEEFIIGSGNSLDKNIFWGTVFTAGGINQSSMPKSIPYKIGELAGDIGSFAFGAAEAGTGAGGELLGFTADGTGVLAPAGVVLNAASLGLVTHGGAATIKSAHNFGEDLFSLIKGEGNNGASNPKLYNPVEFEGTVKVNGEVRDVNRRVYQRSDININYYDENSGLTNLQLMKKGRAPIGSDGNPMLFNI